MMSNSADVIRKPKFSLGKVIFCVILLLSAMALAVELAPADTQVGFTAAAATKAELQKKQAQLETQQKNIASKLNALKKSKAAAQDQLDLVNELVENLQTQITICPAGIPPIPSFSTCTEVLPRPILPSPIPLPTS